MPLYIISYLKSHQEASNLDETFLHLPFDSEYNFPSRRAIAPNVLRVCKVRGIAEHLGEQSEPYIRLLSECDSTGTKWKVARQKVCLHGINSTAIMLIAQA